jgi:bifunctional ADP-heptose synthase (sugar kinase/adenylyltransferase)
MNCDELVVAVNQYAIRAHEPYETRAFGVMGYADVVRCFESEEALLAIMRHHKPDVIFKGEDYYGKPITGGDLARIHWVARHPGYSSTIERAKK